MPQRSLSLANEADPPAEIPTLRNGSQPDLADPAHVADHVVVDGMPREWQLDIRAAAPPQPVQPPSIDPCLARPGGSLGHADDGVQVEPPGPALAALAHPDQHHTRDQLTDPRRKPIPLQAQRLAWILILVEAITAVGIPPAAGEGERHKERLEIPLLAKELQRLFEPQCIGHLTMDAVRGIAGQVNELRRATGHVPPHRPADAPGGGLANLAKGGSHSAPDLWRGSRHEGSVARGGFAFPEF